MSFKKTFIFLSAIALLAPVAASAATARNDMPVCSPIEQTYTVSGDLKIETPLCFSGKAYIVDGFADLAKTDEILSKHDLHPVPINGKALVQISVIRYVKDTISLYKEVVIGVMAAREPNFALSPTADPKQWGFYLMKLWVDQKAPLKAGNEIWGYNKTIGTVLFHDNEDGKGYGFELLDGRHGPAIVSAHWDKVSTTLVPDGLSAKAYLISSGNQAKGQTWAPAVLKADVYQTPVTPANVTIHDDTHWGEILSRIQFNAFRVSSTDGYNGELFAPGTDLK